jgi:L-galactonate 5-dehydrogenase
MTTMKTLVCEQPTKLVYQRRPVPIPAAQEVVIKIITVGICGTDIHAWSGSSAFLQLSTRIGP